ncbi:hypothetical protein [Ligilactobacillus ruminis]|uniref:hypothetical protein n=1 Tax=Ligilactobacillus ruminis TaxID=1623 RepID=UPI003B9CA981
MAYFNNYALFSKDDKQIHITVDYGKEYFSMNPLIEGYTGKKPDDESYTVDADLPEYIEENKKQKEAFASKFQIDFEEAEYGENQYLWGKKLPFNNVLSGAKIDLKYGEGILDFIYADFKSAIKEQLKTIELENLLRESAEQEGIKKAPIHKDEPEKIYSRLQVRIEEYYQYAETISNIEDIAYTSLYSAICPPIFKIQKRKRQKETNDMVRQLSFKAPTGIS